MEDRALLQRVGEAADELGAEAYLIGGPVRDLLLGRSAPDLDIAVDGPVAPLTGRVAERLNAGVRKTTDFMTATIVLADGREVDIARTRREDYPEPGALPVVAPADVQADLLRRDFTINAMAMRLAPEHFGELVDPLGAVEDLRARQLRVLHDESFVDDPTRLYRAVRFLLRLDLHLEERTHDLLCNAVEHRLPALLTGARIRNELSRLFHEAPGRALATLESFKLLEADGLRRAPSEACQAAALLPTAAEALRIDLEAAGPMAINLGVYCGVSGYDPLTLSARLMLGRMLRRRIREAARLIGAPPDALEASGPDSELYFALQGTSSAAAVALWTVLSDASRRRLEHFWLSLRDIEADIDGSDLTEVGCMPGPCFAIALRTALIAKIDRGAAPEEQLEAARHAFEDAATQ